DGGAERFRTAIEAAMRSAEGTNIWYLRVIHQLAEDQEVHTLDISGDEWGEVDFPEDVKTADALVTGWDRSDL
ncbi:MAG: nucleotidyltransferase, partial [Sphingomicrobium sp.]